MIILDWEEKGGRGKGESCGSAQGGMEEKNLKVSYFRVSTPQNSVINLEQVCVHT